MRRAVALAILAIASCHSTPKPPAERTKPKLVVLVVIDQWPSWVFEKQQHLFLGGIARLLKEGGLVPNAELPYANSFTAPGHASISTGTVPRVHGIVGNYWYRRAEGRDRPAEYDASSVPLDVGPPLGKAHVGKDDGASGKQLRVEGVADALERATGGASKTVAIALKPRAACLVAGKKPDLAIWYVAGAGGMTTTSSYSPDVPPWLVQQAKDAPPSRYFESTWDARDPALLAKEAGIADDSQGEKSDHGLGTSFPHAMAKSDSPERAIVETPFADEMVAQTVAVAIDALQLGRDDVPDLLAVSFGAHDYAGHSWGPDSWEVLDLTMRLDVLLGQLFDSLDARLGPDQWAVIVTSDHGATPMVERGRIRSARRISPKEIEAAAESAIEAVAGKPGPWVVKQVSSNLYLQARFNELDAETKDRALDAAANAMARVPGVALAGRADMFASDCSAAKDLFKALCNAMVPGEGGELFAVATAGSVISEYKGGTGHDAPFDDNRRVPILVKAPGLTPQRAKGNLLQVAPTLAALLGIAPPAEAHEPTLFGIQRR